MLAFSSYLEVIGLSPDIQQFLFLKKGNLQSCPLSHHKSFLLPSTTSNSFSLLLILNLKASCASHSGSSFLSQTKGQVLGGKPLLKSRIANDFHPHCPHQTLLVRGRQKLSPPGCQPLPWKPVGANISNKKVWRDGKLVVGMRRK